MRRLLAATLVVGSVFAFSSSAAASSVMILSPRQLATQAQVIVVGKVEDLEKEPIPAEPFPKSPKKVGFQVASVKVTENLLGARGLTDLRVGWQFIPKANPVQPDPGGGIRITGGGPGPRVDLEKGQEVLFFLKKHPSGDFYTFVQAAQPLDKKSADFDKELEQVKKILKVYDHPMQSLEAKEPIDRQLAAYALLQRYRSYPQGLDGKQPLEEAIPADESKLILKIISGMEWGKYDPQIGFPMYQLFQLAVKRGPDGFVPPKFALGQANADQLLGEAVKKWLTENAATYRIQRFVSPTK